MLFFVSFEKQQLFCWPELTRDSGPGFLFSDGVGMLSEGSNTMTTPNMLKLENRHDCRKLCKGKTRDVDVLVKLFVAGRDSKRFSSKALSTKPSVRQTIRTTVTHDKPMFLAQ